MNAQPTGAGGMLTEKDWQTVRKKCGLTRREVDVGRAAFVTRHRPEIAQMLGISAHTVDFHLHNAFVKLGATNRGDFLLRCIDIAGKGGGDDTPSPKNKT